MSKLNTVYTVILLNNGDATGEYGICYDDSGRNPAYFYSEKSAQSLADELNNRHEDRTFVVGTITFYTSK